MTALIERAIPLSGRWRAVPSWLLALGATALGLVMTAPLVGSVLRGGFADPDDAMRLVEVRAWMAGQPWFDLTAHRLDPPLGASMHWSRLVDLPSALLIRAFAPFVDQATAEALTRIALPTLLLFALYLAMTRVATVLLGGAMRVSAVLGLFLSGVTLVQFQPGRIGHHGMETACLMFAVGAALASLDHGHARQAALAGALVALGLAMSLETLPFLGALCVAMAAAWVARGAIVAPALAWFAAGLGAALPLLFLLGVAPGYWLAPVCDAYGAPQCGAGLIGAVGFAVLAWASPKLPGGAVRLAAAAAVGALGLGFVAFAYPACLHSPFAGVDPLVRALWLDHVVESKPLLAFMRDRPLLGLAIVGPVALGVVAGALAAARSSGNTRLRFAIVAGLGAVGLALGFWQVRVLATTAPFALCGALAVVAASSDRFHGLARTLAPMLILPFTTTAWALMLPADAAPTGGPRACLRPAAFTPLAHLPPGRAVAPLDSGSHLLEATPLDVFAAPYHRDNDGNRFALDVFLAAPAKARALLAARHVAYVVTCPGDGETDRLAALAPDGLAARLADGRIPPFLTRVPLVDTPYAVFATPYGYSATSYGHPAARATTMAE